MGDIMGDITGEAHAGACAGFEMRIILDS